MRFAVRSITSAALALVSFAAAASPVTLTGQFMSVTYDDASLPTDFGKVSLVETPVTWSCVGGSCALAGPIMASIVVSSTSGQAVDVTGQTRSLFAGFEVSPTWLALTDPNGQQWGYAEADIGKWSVSANVAQGLPVGDLQFATAYGTMSVRAVGIPGAAQTYSRNLGLHETGPVTLGPGASGPSLIDVDEAGNPILGALDPWPIGNVRVTTLPARWALPSTDSSCASTACMANAAGTVNVSQYMLNFEVSTVMSAVPELSAAPMLLLGLGGLAWAVRRQGRRVA